MNSLAERVGRRLSEAAERVKVGLTEIEAVLLRNVTEDHK
jgi:hypothetical protein